ncbi:hypothetical protein [Azospirillum sp.]|uniref:hypothetical protein n=1 Tax=Azospirillum sp. TaxID=34012 RepID=UPI002D36A1D6|nr:hypothetical protein [Azospirillum sp.]HYD70963.1 hypothetical protein [Azospirillum sp.]
MRGRKAMTIEEVQARIRAAHARIGHEGRFALTLTLNGAEDCYITHWYRPDPHAFEDCRAVGSGTIKECLAALDRYAAAYRRRPTQEEVGRTLGIVPDAPEPPRFLIAAE